MGHELNLVPWFANQTHTHTHASARSSISHHRLSVCVPFSRLPNSTKLLICELVIEDAVEIVEWFTIAMRMQLFV